MQRPFSREPVLPVNSLQSASCLLRHNELIHELVDLPGREHIEDLLREDANERHGPLKQGLTELLHLAEISRRVPSLVDFTISVFEGEFPVDIIIDQFIVKYYTNYIYRDHEQRNPKSAFI